MESDSCVLYGGEVKWVGETKEQGSVAGYLVLFGSAQEHDASPMKDYFTPDTDFDLDISPRRPVYYNHGLDVRIGDRKIGIGEVTRKDEIGLWIEAQLELRDAYVEAIRDMARKGELGWSSGAVAHLVRRTREAKGVHRVLHWPIGEASLTPAPAEPRTLLYMKTLRSLEDVRTRRYQIEQQAAARNVDLLDVIEQRVYWREGEGVRMAPVHETPDGIQIQWDQAQPVTRSIVYRDAPAIPYTPEEAVQILRDAGFAGDAIGEMQRAYARWRENQDRNLTESLQARYTQLMARTVLADA